jgi:hypothetical protein
MILFQEDFNNGLSQWIEETGANNGLVIPDPLGSNTNVLVFTKTTICVDLVSHRIPHHGNNYLLSFDYLGKPLDNTITENLGCSIGIANSNCTTKIYAAAIPHGLGPVANSSGYILLTDDSSWHHYEIPFSFTDEELRLNLQDWEFNGLIPSRAGDCYFKDISIINDTVAAPTIAPIANNQAVYNTATHKVVKKDQPCGSMGQVCVEPNRTYNPITQKPVEKEVITCNSMQHCSQFDNRVLSKPH